jgi:TRAP-type C4-dicarboxylate transport system permease small subunit
MKIVRFLDKTVDILCRGALLCGGILLLVMAFNVTYGVLARYLFNAPSSYTMDLTKMLMIPALVLSVSYVHRYNRHLQVDFIATRLPAKFRLVVLDFIVPLAGLFVAFVLVWKGWEAMAYAYSIKETSYSAWGEPMWPVKLTIPIGYALLFLVMIGQLVGVVAQLFGYKRITPGGSEMPVESELM